MAALTQEFGLAQEVWKRRRLPLAVVKAWKGGFACADTAANVVTKGAASTTLLILGVFAETVDNTGGSAGSVSVDVDFIREKRIVWRDNDGTISIANLFAPCYVLDDHTVTLTATAHSKAGVIMAVDSVLGVAFEIEGV